MIKKITLEIRDKSTGYFRDVKVKNSLFLDDNAPFHIREGH